MQNSDVVWTGATNSEHLNSETMKETAQDYKNVLVSNLSTGYKILTSLAALYPD